MKLSNRLYDILKYVCTIGLPAVAAFIGVVFPVVGIADNITGIVLTVITATATLIGTLIGISNAQYKKEIAEKGKITFLNTFENDVEFTEVNNEENGDEN